MNRAFVLPRRRHRIRPYFDLTAMIDTVFNLLIFFAVISTFGGGVRSGIQMQLPAAKTATPVPDRVVLALLPGRLPQVNGVEVPMDRIAAELGSITRGNLDAQVVVMADKKVIYSDLVGALDRVRFAGYHRIALATAPRVEGPTR
jgi:biopolymer transport protein ExbD